MRWRTVLCQWELATEEPGDFSFPFTYGFGCGGTLKRAQGEKISLQRGTKIGSQIGTKLSIGGSDMSAGVSAEISETLAYEFSLSLEWSYTSRPCEYCFPTVIFPDAKVRIFKRWTYNLPFWATRKTEFLPGRMPEIRSNCRHAPDICANCDNAEASLGAGPVAAAGASGRAHTDRVLLLEREVPPSTPDPDIVLKEILSTPDDEAAPEQLYLLDLTGKTQSVSQPDGRYLLYSVDDIDRSIGAVRLYAGKANRLLLLNKLPASPREQAVNIDLISGNGEVQKEGTLKFAARDGFNLIETELYCKKESDNLFIRVRQGRVVYTWPAIGLGFRPTDSSSMRQ
jgi:hypothetical protein